MSDATSEMLVLRPDVVATVIEDGAVLLDLDTKYFYTVNHPGWAILQLFELGTSCRDAKAYCAKWGASAADADAITRFLDFITGEHLLTAADSPIGVTEIDLPQGWSTPTIEKTQEPLQRIMKSPFDPTLPLAE